MTTALPYANGDIHIGHLVEYIQADVWARFQKMNGHECHFVCADDAHGTPVMLRAEAEGVAPEDLIRTMQVAHERDFALFGVCFDNYHSTHSEENRLLSERMFERLRENGHIVEKEVDQLFDTERGMFLPDRYVRGECPNCAAAGQYGDSCEVCGAAYDSTDLKNPVSILSNTPPEVRSSLHYFLRLGGEEEALRGWFADEVACGYGLPPTPRLQRQIANKLGEWLGDGLRDWDISRDAPYFGFRIPGVAEEKYFYVWLDAPIGYVASFRHFCDRNTAVRFDDFWVCPQGGEEGCDTEVYHFIGKDILYFHGLFWPTMLKNSGYRRPTRLFVHGFLTVNGEKMSKSRGTFITAEKYGRTGMSPDLLRYYYSCKLGDGVDDIDLNLSDFRQRINSDLVGKLVNIPSRSANFVHRFFEGRLDSGAATDDAWEEGFVRELAQAYERRRYHEVVRAVMARADAVNAEVDAAKPWLLAKEEDGRDGLHRVCSRALRRFDLLVGYLSPIVPGLAEQVRGFLGREGYVWGERGIAPLPDGHRISAYSHLLRRLEESQVEKLVAAEAGAETDDGGGDEITIDDFAKVDMRVARVVTAETVEGADKLLALTLDVGDGRPRRVFAGIRRHYAAEDLPGRRVVYLANLRPRKMRFGVSEGMVLAAEGAQGEVVLLCPEGEVGAGARVR